MPVNIYGGGANTNFNGLRFEQLTSLSDALRSVGYLVSDEGRVFRHDAPSVQIALIAPKHKLYDRILSPGGVDWRHYLSKQMLPDDALYNLHNNKVYIVEKKFQSSSGSVDEKLQTCHYKKLHYQKMFASLNIVVEYIYVCNDWFARDEYRDVRQYIADVGCSIYFNVIPLSVLGL